MPCKYKIHDQSGIQIILSPLNIEMDQEYSRQQAKEVADPGVAPARGPRGGVMFDKF